MKLLFTLSTVLFYNSLFSQSNLQFSKVKLIGAIPDTVPSGKIWEVESAIYSGDIAIYVSSYAGGDIRTDDILINNFPATIRKSDQSSAGGQSLINWEQQFPICLSAGTILQARNNVRY
jgi:hypothetical protein